MKNICLFILLAMGTTAFAQTTLATDTNSSRHGLPVLRSYVAPDVVERAKKKYGRPLYCIEKTQSDNCENSYLIGLIKNGKLTIEWMCDDPKMVWHYRKNSERLVTGGRL